MITEDAVLLESTEIFQIMGSRCKEVASRDKEGQWPFKKARGKQPRKYYNSAVVKIKSVNFYERYVSVEQDCLVYHSK